MQLFFNDFFLIRPFLGRLIFGMLGIFGIFGIGLSISIRALAEVRQEVRFVDEKPPSSEGTRVKPFLWIPFVYFTPETQWAGGSLLRWNWSELKVMGRVDQTTLIAFRTLLNQSFVTLNGRWFLNDGWDEFAVTLTWLHYPDRFYGRGEWGFQKEHELFFEARQGLSVSYAKHLSGYFFIRGGYLFENRSFSIVNETGRHYLREEFTKYDKDFIQRCYSVALEYDNRDILEAPTQGQWSRLMFQPCNGWQRYELDLRFYHRVFQATWANQMMLAHVEGAQTPFAMLHTIGGRNLFRGYPFGFLRDQTVAAVQSEYRFDWKDRWIPVAFASGGMVGAPPLFSGRSFPIWSVGAGMHYVLEPKARTKIRLEWARTFQENLMGIYFVNGEAF
ncbi:MAG: hypothetical protein NZ480_02080 [Bdellovibrionaceae bacterium]|nr:hypothetical protein [Pseudobdellovibrionaceae bacterium]